MNKGCKEEFYACSTYRDRKDCGFYLPVGDKQSEKILQGWALERQRVMPSVDHEAMEERLKEVKKVPPRDRLYCHTCGQLDLRARGDQHQSHETQSVISDKMLSHPSQILKPKEGNKKEAQYLFSSCTTQVIVDNLQRAQVSRVLCLGTPRIHEHIQSLKDGKMDSLLLDLDHRYHSFWPRDKFVWYNMFNRHIFSHSQDESKHVLRSFLSSDEQEALIMDPPFGGHVDPLATTVRYFSKLYSKMNPHNELKVIWIFPYFREHHISERCPNLKVVDYKVEYDNHKKFSNGSKGHKLGSPVRLFTNMDLEEFVLPEDKGYRLCQLCTKWVSAENKHCGKCNACTSKDGRTYVHCDQCEKCVKPKWKHCYKCHSCLPTEHICLSQGMESSNDNIEPRHKRLKKFHNKIKSGKGIKKHNNK